MSAEEITVVGADRLLSLLQTLCSQPSTSEAFHELGPTASLIANAMQRVGLETRTVKTQGAPVVIGWRDGRNPYTLLLYHHYDTTPTGPWRNWFHEPFQLAEREGALYGRGVAHGKGPLAAHLDAIRAVLGDDGELPMGVVIVAEGEQLIGSPNLGRVIRRHLNKFHLNACLASAGERDASGIPFCYCGSKGWLQVELSTDGPTFPLSSSCSASVRNPLWRLVWALGAVKGADEDIRIAGFYDEGDGPNRTDNALLREANIDEEGRLQAWNIPEFLFGMSGKTLTRTEVTLPTCNISSLSMPHTASRVSSVPTKASAILDFQLVPEQHPDSVLKMLRRHLSERGFGDISIERSLGGYLPVRTDVDDVFLQHLRTTIGERLYHTPLPLLPFGLFTQPLYLLTHHFNIPVAAVAMGRYDSAVHGPNERILLTDLTSHRQLLMEVLRAGVPILPPQEEDTS
jgi:acetylornithine deacetylase/succinyl-diaminopimelate desuccinylase-like protein